MKILIDGRFWGLENAGLGRYTINLVKSLTRLDEKNSYKILLRKKYFKELKFPGNWEKVLADIPHYSLAEQRQLPNIINSIDVDLVHFLHFNVPLLIKKPFVVTIHDILMHKSKGFSATTLNPVKYLLKRVGYRTTFDNAIYKSKKIMVPSNAVKREVLSSYKVSSDKITVSYEGVDESFGLKVSPINIEKKFGIKKPYILYIGNAYPHKNLGRAVKAVKLANKSLEKGLEFVIVTSRGIFEKRVKKLVKKLNAYIYVKFLGSVNDNDLFSLYKNSLAFFYPSLSEGFGLPGLEALKAGTLLMASDIPVFREVYKDSAIYFDPTSVSAMANALLRVKATTQDVREVLIEDRRRVINSYSWSKCGQSTLETYLSVR